MDNKEFIIQSLSPIGNSKIQGMNGHVKAKSKENKKVPEAKKMQVSTTRMEANKKGQDDELSTLSKLSYMNAGARYELLSINEQLLDFDMNLKVQRNQNKLNRKF